MEKTSLKTCVQNIANHYTAFATHKDDYDAQVKSEINLLVSNNSVLLTAKDKRNIKKAGEALAKDKLKDLRGDAISMADIIEVVESA